MSTEHEWQAYPSHSMGPSTHIKDSASCSNVGIGTFIALFGLDMCAPFIGAHFRNTHCKVCAVCSGRRANRRAGYWWMHMILMAHDITICVLCEMLLSNVCVCVVCSSSAYCVCVFMCHRSSHNVLLHFIYIYCIISFLCRMNPF